MIVIGTAGHIDHGKSSIVRRLTDTDPDRLPEEKARGMTIDLGFAFYASGPDETIAFVDVPGHERFVKNMIAGAGGIDAVMLVVAADDGWMPQSEEHFQIVRLLGVRHGFIVINKIDLVEPDWLELLVAEIREKTTGTFLEDSPIVKVSSVTGQGFPELQSHLQSVASHLERRADIGKPRLYIDRTFVRPGMGGVVTGTLRGGQLQLGQSVTIWPGCQQVKVRTLQSNNATVDHANPGQRTAVSFTGAERSWLTRGGVISGRNNLDFFKQHPILALSVDMLADAAVSLEDRRRVLLITGTTEVEGEIRLRDDVEVTHGSRGIVFFKPDDPVYALVGDHYILRLPTPMVTLGGGQILDHFVHIPRRKQMAQVQYLDQRLEGSLRSLVLSELTKLVIADKESLLESADLSRSAIADCVKELKKEDLVAFHGQYVYLVAEAERWGARVAKEFKAQFDKAPHLQGLPLEMVEQMLSDFRGELPSLLSLLGAQGLVVRNGDLYDLEGRGVALKGVQKQAYEAIKQQLIEHPFDPPGLSELARDKIHQQAIRYMLERGEVHKCGSDFLFELEVWQKITTFIRKLLNEQGKFKVPEVRDEFGLTRKYVIPILEETDRMGLTQRDGDFRVKGDRFEEA